VTLGSALKKWDRFVAWDWEAARARALAHAPSPLDLEVELQEEVVVDDWQIGARKERDEATWIYPITSGALSFDAIVSRGPEGKELSASLDELRKAKTRPPLFGLVHYELCKMILIPLAVFEKKGPPRQLMISDEKINLRDLMGSLTF
jgi:hypothetical protein